MVRVLIKKMKQNLNQLVFMEINTLLKEKLQISLENIVILRISKAIDKDFKIFKNWCESFKSKKCSPFQ